ncbi:hypothetical protein DRJ25_01790 [Candidatus Woesearchaeota archaeon]|nr:MAG: hypothetical protein DRJ25_01790 [Candidatus Woesearchaeota archaeon]
MIYKSCDENCVCVIFHKKVNQNTSITKPSKKKKGPFFGAKGNLPTSTMGVVLGRQEKTQKETIN